MGLTCPQCNSNAFKRNGYTRHGKQNHRCLDCGRQFSLEPVIVLADSEDIELVASATVESNSVKISPIGA